MKIKDVARLAGVSTATVSHVINNTRFVNAVEALIHTIHATDNLGREFKVSAQLVARESTGAAPPAKRKRDRKKEKS